MKDDSGRDIPMPAHVKALLEPFKKVLDRPTNTTTQDHFLLTFIPEHDRLTPEQTQAIGRVTVTWSILERVLGLLLSRLALAPEYPSLALTKDLGLDNQIKALKILVSLHTERYQGTLVTPGLDAVILNMAKEFARLKDKRNIIVHTAWFRTGQDGMSGLSPRPTTVSKSAAMPSQDWTLADINTLSDKIQQLADSMFVVAQLLPDVDEGPLVQSLSPRARHLPPGTRSKPKAPRRPSGK
jgi:hypothetical protein